MGRYYVALTGDLNEKVREAVRLKKFKNVPQLIKYALNLYLDGEYSGVMHGMALHPTTYKDIKLDEATKEKMKRTLGIKDTVDDTTDNN